LGWHIVEEMGRHTLVEMGLGWHIVVETGWGWNIAGVEWE